MPARAQPFWHPKVIQISALNGRAWTASGLPLRSFNAANANGKLANRRQHQALAWMWERIDAGLKQSFRQNPRACAELLPT
jgi:LAO/AO transport system kinase